MSSDYIKTLIHYMLPKQALTTFAGWLANLKIPFIKNMLIHYFVRKYNVNMKEAREENPENYPDFNALFIRQLKPSCRPIATTKIVSPVDGSISEIGQIKEGQLLQAKGHFYSVHELLACEHKQSALFNEGLFATLYLSPKDYHRVHMPIDATLQEMIYVPGKLFSVQPATARMIPRLFARNERLVVFFETAVGPMAMVLVGATIVGTIGTAWHGDILRGKEPQRFVYPSGGTVETALTKAQEMGYFKLGSTVIVLFADNMSLQWQPHLHAGDKIRFGESLGII